MISDNTAKGTVAIFDDDEDILSICSYILEENGWSVHTFTDCNDIADKVAAVQPVVIMMDNWIPDQGGIVATRTLKEMPEYRHIPVIYFSANSDVKILADEAGAEFSLAKPFDLEDLELTLQHAVAQAVNHNRSHLLD